MHNSHDRLARTLFWAGLRALRQGYRLAGCYSGTALGGFREPGDQVHYARSIHMSRSRPPHRPDGNGSTLMTGV